MKLIIEKQGEIVKAIKAEYTPTEALIINQAMLRYVNDEEVNEENRTIMEQMLEVEPIFVEQEPKTDVLDKIIAEIYEEFMTVDGGVYDKSAKKCMQIIDKYKAESEDKE